MAKLPNGAGQFAEVVSAQRQWAKIAMAFDDWRHPDSNELDSFSGNLLAVYVVSGDKEFLVKH